MRKNRAKNFLKCIFGIGFYPTVSRGRSISRIEELMQAIMAGELSSEEALNDPYVQELYEAAGGNEEEPPPTGIPDIFGPQYPEAWGGETES